MVEKIEGRFTKVVVIGCDDDEELTPLDVEDEAAEDVELAEELALRLELMLELILLELKMLELKLLDRELVELLDDTRKVENVVELEDTGSQRP